MGGIFLVVPFLIFLLILCVYSSSPKLYLLIFTVASFFAIGFLDDYLSLRKKESTGLKSREKFFLQSIIAIIFIFLAYEKFNKSINCNI